MFEVHVSTVYMYEPQSRIQKCVEVLCSIPVDMVFIQVQFLAKQFLIGWFNIVVLYIFLSWSRCSWKDNDLVQVKTWRNCYDYSNNR